MIKNAKEIIVKKRPALNIRKKFFMLGAYAGGTFINRFIALQP